MVMKQERISSTHTIQHIMSLDFAVFSNSDGEDATLLVGGWVGAGRRMICNCKCLGIHLVTRTRLQRCIATINHWTDYCNNHEIIVSDYWLSQKHRKIIGPDGLEK